MHGLDYGRCHGIIAFLIFESSSDYVLIRMHMRGFRITEMLVS